MDAVTIPVMAKARIGHKAEAQILQALGVDFIDESEVLDALPMMRTISTSTPSACRSSAAAAISGEALRRIGEGAAMIRTKGEAGSGNVVEAVRHMRAVLGGVRRHAIAAV